MSKFLVAGWVFLLAWMGIAAPAWADNCGSLSDCYGVAIAAATAGVAIPLLLSLLLDFSPVGRLKGLLEAILGRDLLTGARLAWWERLLNLIPGGRAAGRAARAANAADDIAQAGRKVSNTADEAGDAARAAEEANAAAKTADEVNQQLAQKGYSDPPYTVGSKVKEFEYDREAIFLRFHGKNNQDRPWVVKRSEVEGLSREQIREKYSIPNNNPLDKVSEVRVPAGTRIREGQANPLYGRSGGGIQNEIVMDRVPSSWFNEIDWIFSE